MRFRIPRDKAIQAIALFAEGLDGVAISRRIGVSANSLYRLKHSVLEWFAWDEKKNRSELEKLRGETAWLRARIDKLKSQLAEAKKESRALARETDRAKREVESVSAEVSKLRRELDGGNAPQKPAYVSRTHLIPKPVSLVPPGERRPEKRSDCLSGGHNAQRPCPWVSCRYHLALDVGRRGKLSGPEDPEEYGESCALDVADTGAKNLQEIGQIYGLTRERIRQIESRALGRFLLAAQKMGIDLTKLLES